MLLLERGSGHMLFMLGNPFLGAGSMMDAAGTAAEGDVVIPGYKASFHAPAVFKGVVDIPAVDVDDHGVVVEVVASPLAAGKADAAVAKAVVHAAIVADVASPIAFVEDI